MVAESACHGELDEPCDETISVFSIRVALRRAQGDTKISCYYFTLQQQ